MSGQVKLSYYTKLFAFVDGEVLSADFTSPPIDSRTFRRGIVRAEWSGYDGATGKVYLELSDDNDTTDSKWKKWGGTKGECALDSASGSATWELWHSPPSYIRLKLEIGDGTAATLTAKHRLGH